MQRPDSQPLAGSAPRPPSSLSSGVVRALALDSVRPRVRCRTSECFRRAAITRVAQRTRAAPWERHCSLTAPGFPQRLPVSAVPVHVVPFLRILTGTCPCLCLCHRHLAGGQGLFHCKRRVPKFLNKVSSEKKEVFRDSVRAGRRAAAPRDLRTSEGHQGAGPRGQEAPGQCGLWPAAAVAFLCCQSHHLSPSCVWQGPPGRPGEEASSSFPSGEIRRLQEQNASLRDAVARMRTQMEALSEQGLPPTQPAGDAALEPQPDAQPATPGECGAGTGLHWAPRFPRSSDLSTWWSAAFLQGRGPGGSFTRG